jgi:hypothetical protein
MSFINDSVTLPRYCGLIGKSILLASIRTTTMKHPYLLIALAATGRGQSSLAIYNDAKTIARNAVVIRKWAELECNGINGRWTDSDQILADETIERATQKIKLALAEYNGQALFDNTDPRGALIEVVTHDALGRFYSWTF